MTSVDLKFCPGCQQTLTKADFYKRSSQCKECVKVQRRQRWREEGEKLAAQSRARYASNPERFRKQKRDSMARDPERHRERNRKWLKEHGKAWRDARAPRAARDVQLRSLYGISVDEYDVMFEEQAGQCRICQDRPSRGLVVDHCHATGEVRGLLCHLCNWAVGAFNDSPYIAYRAMLYLAGGVGDDDTLDSP